MRAGSAGGILGTVPVHQRIVEVELESLGLARLRHLAEDVALERGVRDVVAVVDHGRPHREAVVVTRGEGHVFRAGVREDAAPFLRAELRGIEAVHHPRIRLFVERAASGITLVEIPFALRVVRVDAPVDEDAEPERRELLTRLEVPFRRLVIGEDAGRQCRDDGEDETLHFTCPFD